MNVLPLGAVYGDTEKLVEGTLFKSIKIEVLKIICEKVVCVFYESIITDIEE